MRYSNIFTPLFFTFSHHDRRERKERIVLSLGPFTRAPRVRVDPPSSRAQAAEQIGELVLQSCKTSSSSNTAGEGSKVHVNAGVLPTVLRKVRECSRAKEWETRVAAGKAMGAIAKNLRRRESPLYPEDEKSNNFIPNDAFCASARDVCKMELIEYELVLEKVAGERANRAKEQRTISFG